MVIIESPVKGYTGISAGVGFALGKALVKELTPTQENYFKKKGYSIKDDDESESKNDDISKVNTLQSNTDNINNTILDNNNANVLLQNYNNLGDID